MISKEMLFGGKRVRGKKSFGEKKSGSPSAPLRVNKLPHSQTQLSTSVIIVRITELSRAILSFSYLVGLERVRGESGNGMDVTLERMGRSLWHRK